MMNGDASFPAPDFPPTPYMAPDPDLVPPPDGPAAPVPNRAPGPRRRVSFGLAAVVLATSVVAATVSSVATAALVVPAARQAPLANASTLSTTTSSGSHATTTVVDASTAIEDVATQVGPAVVTITSSSVSSFGPFSVPATGVGSGFIYDSNGLILTNYHVVEGSGSLKVALQDGRSFTGTVVASNPNQDLAVVKVDATGLPTAPLGTSSGLRVGQTLVAIGSPLGEFTGSVTSGILSATGRSIQIQDPQTREVRQLTDLLQTDAKINEGNSGGPLLDLAGQVIGINSAAATQAEGIGFAIPIDAARSIMASASGASASTSGSLAGTSSTTQQ